MLPQKHMARELLYHNSRLVFFSRIHPWPFFFSRIYPWNFNSFDLRIGSEQLMRVSCYLGLVTEIQPIKSNPLWPRPDQGIILIPEMVVANPPATIEEEEKMLGSEAREIEDAKVCKSSSVLTFHWMSNWASWFLTETWKFKLFKHSERSQGAKWQHRCSCGGLFYGASGFRCCWAQGADFTKRRHIPFVCDILSVKRCSMMHRTWANKRHLSIYHLLTQVFLTHTPPNITFVPLPQKTNSPITYTGHGYIPCDGWVGECATGKEKSFWNHCSDLCRHLPGASSQLMWRDCSVCTVREETGNM